MVGGDGGRRDARERARAREERRRERALRRRDRKAGVAAPNRIARLGQLVLGLEHAGRVEARIHGEQVPEAPDQESGARDQHHRERELRDDEGRPRAAARRRRRAPRSRVQHRLDRLAARLDGGHDGEDDRDCEGRAQRDRQDARIERDGVEARDVGRREPQQRLQARPRQRHADRGGAGAEQERFGEELAQQAAAARAEGPPHRDLLAARRAAGEQQPGDVDARDEQHQCDRCQQEVEHRAHGAEDHGVERLDVHSARLVLGIAALENRRRSRPARPGPIPATRPARGARA